MSAQPVHEHDPHDPHDPTAIMAALPDGLRPAFLADYGPAARAAAEDPAAWAHLDQLLRTWATRAALYADPTFRNRRVSAAMHSADDVPMQTVDALRAR